MSFSNYTENALLEHIVGRTAFSAPIAYIALSTSDPGESGSGIAEPSGNGYARVTTSASTWGAAVGGVIQNVLDIAFPQATGNWGTITYFAIFDALSGGNMLGSGALQTPKPVGTNDIMKFVAGDLALTLD